MVRVHVARTPPNMKKMEHSYWNDISEGVAKFGAIILYYFTHLFSKSISGDNNIIDGVRPINPVSMLLFSLWGTFTFLGHITKEALSVDLGILAASLGIVHRCMEMYKTGKSFLPTKKRKKK